LLVSDAPIRLGSSRGAALPSNETVTTESVGALTDSLLGSADGAASRVTYRVLLRRLWADVAASAAV